MGEPLRRSNFGRWVRYQGRLFRRRYAAGSLWSGLGAAPYPVLELLRLARWKTLGLPPPGGVVFDDRLELLDLAASRAPTTGLWLEFGVATGVSINHLAEQVRREIVGFDSFLGLPQRWSPLCPAGAFSTGGLPPSVAEGVVLVQGDFGATLPAFLASRPEVPVAFVHIDCDLYSSTVTVLRALADRLREGSVLVFDEYSGWLPDDESRAWRETCAREHLTFEWIGVSLAGSVAVRVVRSPSVPGRGPATGPSSRAMPDDRRSRRPSDADDFYSRRSETRALSSLSHIRAQESQLN